MKVYRTICWMLLELSILILSIVPIPWLLSQYYVNRLISRGQAFILHGNIPRALADFSEAVRRCPASGEFRFYLGKALTGVNQFDRAVTELRRAETNYNNFQLYQILGVALANTGDLEAALAAYDRGLCFARDNEELLLLKAKLTLNIAQNLFAPLDSSEVESRCGADEIVSVGATKWCRKDLQRAAELLQGMPENLEPDISSNKDCLLAGIQAIQGATATALATATKGLISNPYNLMGLLWAARLNAQQNNFEAATSLYDALVCLVSILDDKLLLDIYEEVKGLSERAPEPLQQQRLLLLAVETALKAGRQERAVDALNRLPSGFRATYLRGLSAELSGDRRQAREAYRSVLREHPAYLDALRGPWVADQEDGIVKPQHSIELYMAIAP